MNIYKLIAGIILTVGLTVGAPYLAAMGGLITVLVEKAWFVLLVTATGLIVKSLIGDFVAGEFLFYKFGYDNCVVAFGGILTALSIQIVAKDDLFPGMKSVWLLGQIPSFSAAPASDRCSQLLVFLLLALAGTLLAGAISASIKKGTAKGQNFLSLVNSILGSTLLSVYVLVLVTKGE